MDNAQKAIMIGVGLFITIIVIAAVMLITGIGQDLLNSGTQQLSGISESLRTQIIDQYDGKVMTGSQVRSAAVDLVNRNEASIVVNITGGESATGAAATVSGDVDSTEDVRNAVPSTTQKFRATVTFDANSGVATVAFVGQ